MLYFLEDVVVCGCVGLGIFVGLGVCVWKLFDLGGLFDVVDWWCVCGRGCFCRWFFLCCC